MRIHFWGTRGSIPTPGSETVRYGGNTACVEVRTRSGVLLILDCGSGIRPLGHALLKEIEPPIHGTILLSHTHWDHIQGLPFFGPAFAKQNRFTMYGPAGERGLIETLEGQMTFSYWPVGLDQFAAQMSYVNMNEGELHIEDVVIKSQYLNHPGVTQAYRIEADGAVLVYATDHEPFTPQLYRSNARPGLISSVLHEGDRRHAAFLSGADLIIHDAQYTEDEYAAKHGWGHSPIPYVIEMAKLAGAEQLALFHHDPERGDGALDDLQESASRMATVSSAGVHVFAATEGQTLLLERAIASDDQVSGKNGISGIATGRAASQGARVLLVEDDVVIHDLLTTILEQDGYHLSHAFDGNDALRQIHDDCPDLVILDLGLPMVDGIEVLQHLRSDDDSTLRNVPVVLLTAETGEDPTQTAFAAGATDYMTKPFVSSQVRARIRHWLGRGNSTPHQPGVLRAYPETIMRRG